MERPAREVWRKKYVDVRVRCQGFLGRLSRARVPPGPGGRSRPQQTDLPERHHPCHPRDARDLRTLAQAGQVGSKASHCGWNLICPVNPRAPKGPPSPQEWAVPRPHLGPRCISGRCPWAFRGHTHRSCSPSSTVFLQPLVVGARPGVGTSSVHHGHWLRVQGDWK